LIVQKESDDPKIKKVVDAADGLSLGISIVVAVLIGVGIGLGLRHLTGINSLLWVGVFWGIAGAITNVYRAYRKQQKVFDDLANDPRYAHHFRDQNAK